MKTMKPLSLAETGFLPKASKPTRKAVFLAERERVVPWARLEGAHRAVLPSEGEWAPARAVVDDAGIHFMLPWFGYSDPAMEEASPDIPLLRQFGGLEAFEDGIPDESTLLCFWPLLEQHDLAAALFAEVNALLAAQGLTLKRGSGVEATLIAAPSSTNNQAKQRDPEMSQTKQGNPWYFGRRLSGWMPRAAWGTHC